VARRAFICGLAGPQLTQAERAFLFEARPLGIILFARNVETPDQLKTLVGEARAAAGSDSSFLVLIDQEGGRVQRLRPPHWRAFPPAASFAQTFPGDLERAAHYAYLVSRLLAEDLFAAGINVNCAPVLDLPVPGADRIIGDRAYGDKTEVAVLLAGAAAQGLIDGGVLPVVKHVPGHGRATADSHLALPVINEPLDLLIATDFAPFKALRRLPLAMTAHVVLTAIDTSTPVTVSPRAIAETIRGHIGYDGLLMTDDLSMKALSGTLAERTRAAFSAGCDVALHCNGNMAEMQAVAAETPELAGRALERLLAAIQMLKPPTPFDREEAERARLEVLAVSA
jgi:beta-N-acetylhexosaminidase